MFASTCKAVRGGANSAVKLGSHFYTESAIIANPPDFIDHGWYRNIMCIDAGYEVSNQGRE